MDGMSEWLTARVEIQPCVLITIYANAQRAFSSIGIGSVSHKLIALPEQYFAFIDRSV